MLQSRLASLARRRVVAAPATLGWRFASVLNDKPLCTRFLSNDSKSNSHQPQHRQEHVVIPGMRSDLSSLGGDAIMPNRQHPVAPWQAEHNIDVQRVTRKAIVYELAQQSTRSLEEVVPWFLDNMPSAYFRQVHEQYRNQHLKSITAVKEAGMDMYLNLKTQLPDGRQVLTFIRPGTAAGTLLRMVEELPWKHNDADYLPLTRILVFSAKDESMSLNMFVYGVKNMALPGHFDELEAGRNILDYAAAVQRGDVSELEPNPLYEPEPMKEFLQRCTENYIRALANEPRRFLTQRALIEQVSGTEGTRVYIEPAESEDGGEGSYWVDVAVANSLPQVALENVCRLLFHHHFDVTRSRLDIVNDGDNGTVTILRMLAAPVSGKEITVDTFEMLQRELKRAKWLDPLTMELFFDKYKHLGVARAEIITAFGSLLHPIMAKENAMAFSKANILATICSERFMPYSEAVADLFVDRFNPNNPLSDADFKLRCNEIIQLIKSDVEDTVATELFLKMVAIVTHTLKTNLYMPDRYALGLRLDPRVMETPADKGRELPFGIVFVHGRRFNGYHVRFRDIARGGLRLVTPPTPEQYSLESARQYDECYGLAFAQQLKNKDIPEGGSKAVCLVDPTGIGSSAKQFVMRKSVKAFTDTILDLIVLTDETKENIIDLYGKKEVLYLGPDEQIIPDDINWIIKRAGYRGYDTPNAFMSSKPRAGINHKEFGVTSEGVNVYLDVALRQVLGIDPKKDTFTIKMTGGPDGDVAGNELKILFREYNETAKVVGIADASGCCEDPAGLDQEELLRLVTDGLAIGYFNPAKLGIDGVLHKADNPEGIKARNSMHNRLKADAFMPCGGRPNTIDITNYRNFIAEEGVPSSPLIVEGANLFITKEARKALFEEAGVAIIKDSSANKGGVITSSYEICAAMLLDEDVFLENKTQIVSEVLEKLRGAAHLEATLLFREFEVLGTYSLPEMSQVISDTINAATDALAVALDTLSEQDRQSLLPLFRSHLPKTVADLGFDNVSERVPEQYIKNAIASSLASKLVYKEGTLFISSLPKAQLAMMALKYLEKEQEVMKLLEVVQQSDLAETDKVKVVTLLDLGGARTALSALQ
ncbi:hypothetical protein MPSEU_000791700 [Mayamaea pseudoterrestris]|nr:hypothetical protein MPSEU_000791700 [Mayamaea pseudoterrestris]